MDLIPVTTQDEERDRLDTLRKALEEERRIFTEAAIQLGKDRVALEVGSFSLVSFPSLTPML